MNAIPLAGMPKPRRQKQIARAGEQKQRQMAELRATYHSPEADRAARERIERKREHRRTRKLRAAERKARKTAGKLLPADKYAFAEQMRSNPTASERILWKHLKKIKAPKFKNQVVILGWIADFYCSDAKLVVEVDGSIHGHTAQAEKDAYRDQVMADHGFKVLRVPSKLVISDVQAAVAQIMERIG